MRILFLNATGQLGGAERVLVCLLEALRKAEPAWELDVVAGDDGPLVQHLTSRSFSVTVLAMPARLADFGEANPRGALSLPGLLLASAAYLGKLRRLVSSRAPDIVQTMNFKMHLLAACLPLGRAKLCWHMHDYVSHRRLTSHLIHWLSPRAHSVIAISESVAADVRKVSRVPARVRTIHNAIDLEHFSPEGAHQPLPPGPSIGLIATFARWKGHVTFLHALASMPQPWHAYIVGGALYRTPGSQVTLEELQQLTESLGLRERVTFTGFMENTAPLLRALDVVVHASTEPEPFGLVIAEAMACGRAVVASMAGGAGEILHPGLDGLGHRPGDVHGLASAIQRFLDDPDLRSRLGASARRSAEARFHPARMAWQLVEAYHCCLRGTLL